MNRDRRYVLEVGGQMVMRMITNLVKGGNTPYQVADRVHETLKNNFGWDAPPPFVRAVESVARDVARGQVASAIPSAGAVARHYRIRRNGNA